MTLRTLRLRWFEVRDRLIVIRYTCPPDRVLPVYVGPVGYEERLGWLRSWRVASGVEAGLAGRHVLVTWSPPGPRHWFWNFKI